MSCLTVDISKINGSINVSYSRIGGIVAIIARVGYSPIINVTPKNAALSVQCSVVCSIGVDDKNREVFMVREGVFLSFDGQTFNVLKRGVQQ